VLVELKANSPDGPVIAALVGAVDNENNPLGELIVIISFRSEINIAAFPPL